MHFVEPMLQRVPREPHVLTPEIWRPPRAFDLKINVDAAFDSTTSKGYFGLICRDDKCNFITASSNYLYAAFPLVVEALAMGGAVVLGQSLCVESVIFESVCLNLVQACRN